MLVPEEKTAAQGSIALLISSFLTALLNYAFSILMSWLLPVNRYGMFGVVQTILTIGGPVLGAGFPWALIRTISRRPTTTTYAGSTRAALVGNLAVGLALSGVLYSATLGGWLPLGVAYQPLILFASATMVTLAITSVFSAALQGFLRFSALGIVRTIEVIVKFTCGTILVLVGTGVVGAVAGFFVGALISTLLAAVFLRDLRLWRGRGWGEREVFTGVVPFFLGMLSLALLVNMDTLGLKFFSNPVQSDFLAGQYQAAVTLARVPIFLTLALFNAVFPYIAQHSPRSGIAKAYVTLALKYTFLFIVPLDLIFIVMPDSVIQFFYSSAYEKSAIPLVVAALGTILLTLIHAGAMLLQASGRLRVTASALPAAVVLEIVALWWLVPRYGTIGAALGLVVAGAFSLCLLIPTIMHTYSLTLSVRAFAAYGLSLGAFFLPLRLLPVGNREITAADILLAGAIYLVSLAVLGLLRSSDIDTFAGGLPPRLGRMIHGLGIFADRLHVLPLVG